MHEAKRCLIVRVTSAAGGNHGNQSAQCKEYQKHNAEGQFDGLLQGVLERNGLQILGCEYREYCKDYNTKKPGN